MAGNDATILSNYVNLYDGDLTLEDVAAVIAKFDSVIDAAKSAANNVEVSAVKRPMTNMYRTSNVGVNRAVGETSQAGTELPQATQKDLDLFDELLGKSGPKNRPVNNG